MALTSVRKQVYSLCFVSLQGISTITPQGQRESYLYPYSSEDMDLPRRSDLVDMNLELAVMHNQAMWLVGRVLQAGLQDLFPSLHRPNDSPSVWLTGMSLWCSKW